MAISRTIAAHLGHSWLEVLLGDGAPEGLGAHPWDTLPPYVLDTSAAARLGFAPVGTYAETVGPEIDWLVATFRAGDPRGLPPSADDVDFSRFFDYAWLARRSARAAPS